MSGAGHSPSPDRPSFGRAGGVRGHFLWARGVRVWGPVTNPIAHTLARWRCALWRRQKVSCFREGCLGLSAHPPPAARPLGRLSGSTTHRLWVWVNARADPAVTP